MPNWCQNVLIISGSTKNLEDFKDKSADGNFSLQTYHPMPESLEGTTAPAPKSPDLHEKAIEWLNDPDNEIWTQEHYDKQVIAKRNEYEQAVLAKKETGYTCWYDWNLSNWGTKWDVNDKHGPKMEIKGHKSSGARQVWNRKKRICLTFDSAWSPPSEGIRKISGDYPSLTFILRYAEAGMVYAGTEVFSGGACTHHEEGDVDDYLESEHFNEYY